MRQSTDTAGKGTSRRLKYKPLERRVWGRIRLKSRLTCCGLVTANELDSKVAVVYGCFLERGDSIIYKQLLLGAIASEAAGQLTGFSG